MKIYKSDDGWTIEAEEWSVTAPTLDGAEKEAGRYAFLYGNLNELSVGINFLKQKLSDTRKRTGREVGSEDEG